MTNAAKMFKTDVMSLDIKQEDPTWYLDSRAAKHVIGDSSNMFGIKIVEHSKPLVGRPIQLKVKKCTIQM